MSDTNTPAPLPPPPAMPSGMSRDLQTVEQALQDAGSWMRQVWDHLKAAGYDVAEEAAAEAQKVEAEVESVIEGSGNSDDDASSSATNGC